MSRTVKLAVLSASCLVASLAFATGAAAKAKLTADYRFEGNYKSSGVDAPKLDPVGSAFTFDEVQVGGSLNGVWTWAVNNGLRLEQATKVLGSKGKAYTVVMLVRLDTVDGYNKIVDFENLDQDEGWYVYEESLYAYDLDGWVYDEKLLVQAEKWRQIALTRTEHGVVRGYVGNKRIDGAPDEPKDFVLGPDKILHFLLDDSNPDESTGGDIARLRIWDTALSKRKIKHLGK
jgi:hypothetical protein